MGKTQFNVRIKPVMKDAAIKVAEASEFTRDDIVEAALVALFGTQDKWLLAKRDRVQQIAKDLNLSFKDPDRQPDRELIAA
jgi:hypothetical protein